MNYGSKLSKHIKDNITSMHMSPQRITLITAIVQWRIPEILVEIQTSFRFLENEKLVEWTK